MGTIRDMSATSPRLFKDSWGRTRNPRNKFISPHCDPTSRQWVFREGSGEQEKATLPEAPYLHHQTHWCYQLVSTTKLWIFSPTPFQAARPSLHIEREHPCLQGSTNSCPTAVHMKPCSTSVFNVLTWVFATTTKICTRDCFT